MTAVLKFLCRLIPAVTFIFSGFVKAVDPVGGAIKFSDYFVAFHMDWLTSLSMPLAIILAAVEFLLGFYLLLGLFMRQVTFLVLGFMSFFTLLTLYIAIFNPVSNCGCFGDAITLTNWQTFWKNVFVMVFTLGMFFYRKHYNSHQNVKVFLTAGVLAIYIISVSVYGLGNLPILDFRPFKTGNNIHEMMSIPEGAEMPEYETLFVLEKDGNRQTFTLDNYPYEDTTWVFIDSETRVIKEGYVPPLQTFSLLNNQANDVTNAIVTHEGALLLMVAPRLNKINNSSVMPLAELSEYARQKGIPFYCVTASGAEETVAFESSHSVMFEYLHTDESTLKTMIRSNPGLILMYDGTIIGKWHYNNLPGREMLSNPLAVAVSEINRQKNGRLILAHILGMILLSTLIFTSKTNKQ